MSAPFPPLTMSETPFSRWPDTRLTEARAVIADVAHHSDHLIRLACNVLTAHGESDLEKREARALLLVVDALSRSASPRAICGPGGVAMKRRGTPEADLQRAVVQALRVALPRTAILQHCPNEVTDPGPRGAKRQSILVGMGVHPGFTDLIVLCDGRVLFLELKSIKGRLSLEQEAFRDTVLAQGHAWALVRSLDDALGALAEHGFTSRVSSPLRRAAP